MVVELAKYKKIGETYFSECNKCGVWIEKGKMREHKKKDCEGEEFKKEMNKISKEVLGIINKAIYKKQ